MKLCCKIAWLQMTETKSVSQIMGSIKMKRRSDIQETVESATLRMNKCSDELESILLGAREWDWDLPSKFKLSIGTYSDRITISDAVDKEAYDNMLLCLVDKYGDGKRSADGEDGVEYQWDNGNTDYWQKIYIYLKVRSSISGCVVVKKRVYVPRVVVPSTVTEAHFKEENVLECAP